MKNMEHFLDHLARSYNEWEDYCRGFAEKIWGGIDDSRIEWAAAEFKIPDSYKGKLVLNIYRDQEDRTMALDEIEGFE